MDLPAMDLPNLDLPNTDLIVFGSLYLEVVFGEFDHLPGPGEEIFTGAFAFSCGGALTPAVAARRAGATAGIATLLGDDLGSKLAIEHCRREGVDLSVAANGGRTGGRHKRRAELQRRPGFHQSYPTHPGQSAHKARALAGGAAASTAVMVPPAPRAGRSGSAGGGAGAGHAGST